MVVIDETGGSFSALSTRIGATLLDAIRQALRARRTHRDHRADRRRAVRRERRQRLPATPRMVAPKARCDTAGFNPVRTLAERDGFRFVEGLKG